MKKISLLLGTLLTAASAFAWGQKGHDAVAYIAEKHLSAAAADSVATILDGKSPVYWANWLDNASHTPDYAYTKTWHYKNIDAGVKYQDAPLNPKGDVVTAIREQIAILRSPKSTKEQKALALKILIHTTGDMHQPMHMGRYSDRGGNRLQVRFFDQGSNLHSVWDTKLPNAAHAWTYTEWADQLDRLSPDKAAEVASGNIDDWARQTHSVAERLYDRFAPGSRISYNEIAAWTPVVEQQLLGGGLRLARILNALFDPASQDNPADF